MSDKEILPFDELMERYSRSRGGHISLILNPNDPIIVKTRIPIATLPGFIEQYKNFLSLVSWRNEDYGAIFYQYVKTAGSLGVFRYNLLIMLCGRHDTVVIYPKLDEKHMADIARHDNMRAYKNGLTYFLRKIDRIFADMGSPKTLMVFDSFNNEKARNPDIDTVIEQVLADLRKADDGYINLLALEQSLVRLEYHTSNIFRNLDDIVTIDEADYKRNDE